MTSLQVVHDQQYTQKHQHPKFSFTQIDRLVIHLTNCIRIIPLDKIEFIQASSNYSVIHMTDGSKLMTSKTLKSVSQSLGEQFFRTHKSFIVNLKYISEYRFRDSQILMESNKVVMVSRANKGIMKEVFS